MSPTDGSENVSDQVKKLMNLELGIINDFKAGKKDKMIIDFKSETDANPWIAIETLVRKTDHSATASE